MTDTPSNGNWKCRTGGIIIIYSGNRKIAKKSSHVIYYAYEYKKKKKNKRISKQIKLKKGCECICVCVCVWISNNEDRARRLIVCILMWIFCLSCRIFDVVATELYIMAMLVAVWFTLYIYIVYGSTQPLSSSITVFMYESVCDSK